jgi:hypothetical protein
MAFLPQTNVLATVYPFTDEDAFESIESFGVLEAYDFINIADIDARLFDASLPKIELVPSIPRLQTLRNTVVATTDN